MEMPVMKALAGIFCLKTACPAREAWFTISCSILVDANLKASSDIACRRSMMMPDYIKNRTGKKDNIT